MADVNDLAAAVNRRASVRAGDLLDVCKGIVSSVADALHERDRTIAALEQRIAALEARPAGVRWIGTFKHGETYTAGGLVTDRGGLWLCLAETMVRPGDSSNAWKLIVKSGSYRD